MRFGAFPFVAVLWIAGSLAAARLIANDYYFFAGIAVLQLVALSSAWNITGGMCGYINFGTTAFVALGAYSATIVGQFLGFGVPLQIGVAAVTAGGLGLATGFMTLRLKGIFFAISTLAISIILETVIDNIDAVGGARGMPIIHTEIVPFFSSYDGSLFFVMSIIALIGIALARYLQISWIGRSLRSIRDNEEAAECLGVPTLRMKLLAATLSGALMGAAGAPMPLLASYIEPGAVFKIEISVLALAAPLVGGTGHWLGPVVGALLLGVMSQVLSVAFSSEVNTLLVGVVLVLAVTLAPNGLLGLVTGSRNSKSAQARIAGAQ